MTVLGGTRPAIAPVCTPGPCHRAAPGPNEQAVRELWPAAWGGVLALALVALGRHALPDDGMISLAYARNVAEHACWCLTSGIGAHTATSPLNVALLAIGIVLFGSPMVSVAVLLAGCLATTAMWLRTLGGEIAALLGPALLVTAPVLTSSLGLETYLAATLLVGMVRYGRDGRWAAVGVTAGLAVLARPDMAVAAVVVVAVVASAGRWWPRVPGAAAVSVAVAGPWFVLAWWRLGSAWPDTLPVKAGQSGWGPDGSIHLAGSLPMYLDTWTISTLLSVVGLTAGAAAVAVAVRRRAWPVVALGAGGAADLVAMAATAQAPAAYYTGPAVAGLGLAAVLVAAGPWSSRSTTGSTTGLVLSSTVVGLIVVSGVFTLTRVDLWGEGVAPVRQNWASNEQYARIADDLPTDGVVYSSGEIGALAFFCLDRGCRVVDPFLSDPGRTARYVDRWRDGHPWAELNYRHHRPADPMPARWRLDFTANPPDWALTWPVRGSSGEIRSAVLVPAG